MNKTVIAKTIYIILLTSVILLVAIAILTNTSKFTKKQNILKYETVIFEKNSQLNEVLQKNYDIDNLAGIFDVHRDTINRWLVMWDQKGVLGLYDIC